MFSNIQPQLQPHLPQVIPAVAADAANLPIRAVHEISLNGSVASVKGTPAFGVYAASKAAIRLLCEPGRRI